MPVGVCVCVCESHASYRVGIMEHELIKAMHQQTRPSLDQKMACPGLKMFDLPDFLN